MFHNGGRKIVYENAYAYPVLAEVTKAVNRQLERRGFDMIPEGADFLIAVHVGKKEKYFNRILLCNIGSCYNRTP